MPNDNSEKSSSLKDLLGEIEDELESEKAAAMTKEEQVLSDIARRILRLERDLTMPGHPAGRDKKIRVERLAAFIESEDF